VPDSDFPLWLKINMQHNAASLIFSTLYKPESYVIEIKYQNKATIKHKLIVPMSKVGFMIDPLVVDNISFLQAHAILNKSKAFDYGNQLQNRVVSFKVKCKNIKWLCSEKFDVLFNTIEKK